jgi:hypothetical protein
MAGVRLPVVSGLLKRSRPGLQITTRRMATQRSLPAHGPGRFDEKWSDKPAGLTGESEAARVTV